MPERHLQYIQHLRGTLPRLAEAILRGPPVPEPRDPSDEEYDYYLRGLELREYAFVPYTYTAGGDEFHRRCEARLTREREQERLRTLEAQLQVAEENLRVQQERLDERRSTLNVKRRALEEARQTGNFERVHEAFLLQPFAPPPPPPYTSAYRQQLEAAGQAAVGGESQFAQSQQSAKRQRTAGPALGAPVIDLARPGPSGLQVSRTGSGPTRQVRIVPLAELQGEAHLPPYRRTSNRQRIALSNYATLAELVVQDENDTSAKHVSAWKTERENRRQLEELDLAALRRAVSRLQAERHVRGDLYPSQAEIDYQEQIEWYLRKQTEREASQRREAEAKQRKADEQARAERAARFEREEEEHRGRSGSSASRGSRSVSRDRHDRDRRDSYDRDREPRGWGDDSRGSTSSRASGGQPGTSGQQPSRGRGKGANAEPLGTRGKSLAPPGGTGRGRGPPEPPPVDPAWLDPDYQAWERGEGAHSAKGRLLRGQRQRRPSAKNNALEFGDWIGGPHETPRSDPPHSSTPGGASDSRTGRDPPAYDPVAENLRRIRLEQERREEADRSRSSGNSPLLPPSPVPPPAPLLVIRQVLGDPAYEAKVQECRERVEAYYRKEVELTSIEYSNLMYYISRYEKKKKAREQATAEVNLQLDEERRRDRLEETLRSNRETQRLLQGAVNTPVSETLPWPLSATLPAILLPTSSATGEEERMLVDPLETPEVPAFIPDAGEQNWSDVPVESPPSPPIEPVGSGDGADLPDVDVFNFPQHSREWRGRTDASSISSDATALLPNNPPTGEQPYQPGYYQEAGGSGNQQADSSAAQQSRGGGPESALSRMASPTRRSARLARLTSPESVRSQSTDRTELLVRSPGSSVSAAGSNAGRAGRSAPTSGRESVVRSANDGQGVVQQDREHAAGTVPRPDGEQGPSRGPASQDGGSVSGRGRTQQRLPPESPRSSARRRGGPVDKDSKRHQK